MPLWQLSTSSHSDASTLTSLRCTSSCPRNPDYATCATGDEYKYRKILAEAIIEGVPNVLIDRVPTWEPTDNVPKSHLKAYRDKTRVKRKVKRRAKELVLRARAKD
jgi:hypothetical protein